MATNFPTSVDSFVTKIDGTSDVLASDINNLQDAVVALENKVGTSSAPFVGKSSGADSVAALSTTAVGGSFTSMWTRRGVGYLATAATTGSSYAPHGGIQYTHNSGYSGLYSWGTLNNNAANQGEFVIHHINSAATAEVYWRFNGASGDFTASGNVTANSDERLKENWRSLSPDFVKALAQVKVGVYDRKDTGETQVGVSAQSLRAVLSAAVMESADGTLSVAYGNAALAACVMLAKELEELKTKLGF